MRLTFDGVAYDLDVNTIRNSELIQLKKRAGIANKGAFIAGVNDEDPEVLQAALWLLLNRAGTAPTSITDVDFESYQVIEDETDRENARAFIAAMDPRKRQLLEQRNPGVLALYGIDPDAPPEVGGLPGEGESGENPVSG